MQDPKAAIGSRAWVLAAVVGAAFLSSAPFVHGEASDSDGIASPVREVRSAHAVCGKGRAMAAQFRASQVQRDSSSTRLDAHDDTDVLHYQLDFEISDIDPIGGSCWLAGSNRMHIRSLSPSLTEFTFRLSSNAFVVTNALLNDATVATVVVQSPTTQVVTLDRVYGVGEEFFLTIEYEGHPSVWVGEEAGVPFVATLSEAWWAHDWWPVKDGDIGEPGDQAEKATMEFSITVPDNFDVPSNGLLQSVDALAGGRARYNWASNYPNTAYGVSFAVSEYNRWTETYLYPGGEMPVEFYIYDAWDTTQRRDAWSNVVNMIGALAGVWGEYPFIDEKYGIYNFPWGGGMEHQTMTGQGGGWFAFTEDLTAHELAHSWWGDMVTCKHWNDIWLNEGFATHGECLWHEFETGVSNIRAYISCMANNKPSGAGANGTVYVYPWELFEWRIFSSTYSYSKGAWVLHQLRGVVGDQTFFDILAAYRAAHAYSAATTEEFIAIASATYGQDLEWFFDQWVYNAGAPAYAYDWETTSVEGQDYLQVWIVQTQQPPNPDVFVMPVDLVVTIGGNTETLTVWNDSRIQMYDLPVSGPVTSVQFDPDEWILRNAAVLGDCNGNGISDACDIDCGAPGCPAPPDCGGSQDCNGNGIADDCEADCNGNGVADDCDIAAGSSGDCNDNLIPDECDDCNGNGVPDVDDIQEGTSLDCDANCVPDECDDCNGNGVPDGDDINSGTSLDCDGNCVPDECDPDCNGNGVPDPCDVADGTSPDVNGDGIPDECAAPPTMPTAPQDMLKNRYLSFSPANDFVAVAFSVALPDGRTAWVDTPQSLNWGGVDAAPVSLLVDGPVVRTWSEETVHIAGCAVVPDEGYEIRATADGANFTAPLLVQTVPAPSAGSWADIVGSFDSGSQTWSAPNGFVNFQDIDAAVKKFQVVPTAPHVTVVDLNPQWPNYVINFSDIDMVIKGFQGVAYPVPAADCQTIANCPLGGAASCLP